jgi:phage tail sheath protein FI
VWKAPAGTEAVIRGAVGVVSLLVKAHCDTLNPKGINAIMPRANYGIVIWGARSMNPVESMKYISDVLLNVNVKESIKNGTQWAVFEPNNKLLWTKVRTAVISYLDSLWRAGGLVGDSAEQAYFVKCDADVNTEESIAAGKLICEVGYAPTKPAEFVIFRISHSISSN